MRVLLVGHDQVAARKMEAVLRAEGAAVEVEETGVDGLETARHYEFDVVVIAAQARDWAGADIVRSMRRAAITTPLLLLAPGDFPASRVRGFVAGADDVLSMPWDGAELAARLRVLVRRNKGHSTSCLTVGNVTVDFDTHECRVDGVPVHLTGKEQSVIELLAMRRDVLITKATFMDHLYGGMDEPDGTKIIDVFICKLRKKLAAVGADNVVGTVWGRGYVMRSPPVALPVPVVALDCGVPMQGMGHLHKMFLQQQSGGCAAP